MSAALNTRAMLGAMMDKTPPVVAYLIDDEGRTVGGPTVVRSCEIAPDGWSVSVDVSVPVAVPASGGEICLYAAAGALVGFPVDQPMNVGDHISPPPFGLISV
jgi:hypothetical protein